MKMYSSYFSYNVARKDAPTCEFLILQYCTAKDDNGNEVKCEQDEIDKLRDLFCVESRFQLPKVAILQFF